MYIIHNFHYSQMEDIFRKGILPANETGVNTWRGASNPDLIYLTLGDSNRAGEKSYYLFVWGHLGVVLNDDWVKEHAEQFLDNSITYRERYQRNLKQYGITGQNDDHVYMDDRNNDCIVSTKPIPVEALDLLVLDSSYHDKSLVKQLPRHMGLYLCNDMLSNPRVTVVKEPEALSLAQAK
jgi:hypothetical protein